MKTVKVVVTTFDFDHRMHISIMMQCWRANIFVTPHSQLTFKWLSGIIHCEILGSYLQQHHQHTIFSALF